MGNTARETWCGASMKSVPEYELVDHPADYERCDDPGAPHGAAGGRGGARAPDQAPLADWVVDQEAQRVAGRQVPSPGPEVTQRGAQVCVHDSKPVSGCLLMDHSGMPSGTPGATALYEVVSAHAVVLNKRDTDASS